VVVPAPMQGRCVICRAVGPRLAWYLSAWPVTFVFSPRACLEQRRNCFCVATRWRHGMRAGDSLERPSLRLVPV